MKSKKLKSPPPPKRSAIYTSSEESEAEEESEVETTLKQESGEYEDDSDQESDNENQSSSGAAKKIKHRRTTGPAVWAPTSFSEDFLRSVAEKFKGMKTEPYKKTLAKYDWGSLTDDGEELKMHMEEVCKGVVRNLTMHQIMTIACIEKGALLLANRRKRGLNAFTLFVREFTANQPTMSASERFAEANKAYKLLSPKEREELMNKARKTNLDAGIVNGVSMNVSSKSAAKDNYPSIKSFFETSSKGLVEPSDDEKKVKEAAPSKAFKGSSSTAGNNMDTVQVKLYDYFAEERKRKFGKEKQDVVKKAFVALSVEKKVKLIYKIMESVESKFNKRAVLSKQDQDLLNSYEQRPAKPCSAYNIFVCEKTQDPSISGLPFTLRVRQIGSMWKNLDAEAKSVYEKKLEKQKSEFEVNYNRFLEGLPEFRREQESNAQKGGRALKRRASVGDEANADAELIPSKESKKLAPVAAKRMRSKTIDCAIVVNKIGVEKLKQGTVPTSAKKPKKSNETMLNGTASNDSAFVSPTKKMAKTKVVADAAPPVDKTPLKSITPVAKAKKNTPAKEVFESTFTNTDSDAQTPAKKKKKNANDTITENESVSSPKKNNKSLEKLPSPIKEPTIIVEEKKPKKKKSMNANDPITENEPISPPKKSKKNNQSLDRLPSPVREPTIIVEEKKPKKKKSVGATEVVEPSPKEVVVKSHIKEKKTKSAVSKQSVTATEDLGPSPKELVVKSIPKEKKTKSAASKQSVTATEDLGPSPKELVVKSIPKDKKTKGLVAKDTNAAADEMDSIGNRSTESAKKTKTKNKVPLPEPEKPPATTKAYYKMVYKGDKSNAKKAFKKLTEEEKKWYHEQLKQMTEKYIVDFRRYLESLSKEEIADYLKRNDN